MVNELALLHAENSNPRSSTHTNVISTQGTYEVHATDPNVMWRSDRYCQVYEEGPDMEGTYKGHCQIALRSGDTATQKTAFNRCPWSIRRYLSGMQSQSGKMSMCHRGSSKETPDCRN